MKNPWKRKLYYYYAKTAFYSKSHKLEVTRCLGFFSYHMIKWYHGEQKLVDMAMRMPVGAENDGWRQMCDHEMEERHESASH